MCNRGGGCLHQVFAVRQVCEKCLENGKSILGVYGFGKGVTVEATWIWIWQQRSDGGGCVTMRERPKSVESPGTYVTE